MSLTKRNQVIVWTLSLIVLGLFMGTKIKYFGGANDPQNVITCFQYEGQLDRKRKA